MDWAQILVIILAVFFAIFLLLAILLAVLLIRVTRQIRAAASSAERTVAAIEGAVTGLSRASLPLAISKTIINQVMKAKSKQSEESKSNESKRR